MVNPAIVPAQRRPGSGPFANEGSGGSDFEPFDNSYYFDPEYVNSSENGSIAGPFTTWAQFVAVTSGGASDGAEVWFPGYPVTPGAEPIGGDKALLIQGVNGVQNASYINALITLGFGAGQSTSFNDMALEAILLDGGSNSLTFRRCEVGDVTETDNYSGAIFGFDSSFLIGQITPNSVVTVVGGSIASWDASSFVLTNVFIGSSESAGELIINDDISRCRLVTFGPGSTVEFTGAEGQLYLDPASYRSFIDNNIQITNGVVVRDDGSFPINAEVYTGLAIDIDWALNPRALVEQDDDTAPTVLTFFPPLTREVVLIVDNTTTGENFQEFTWPANCRFNSGVVPEQETGISVYKLEYEEQLDVYLVYVVLMNALPDGS